MITRWPILQKVRDHSFELSLLVGTRFQVLFHSPCGVLFTFPSRYLFAIGHMLVFSLRGWAPCLHSKFLVFTATCSLKYFLFCLQDFHFLWFIFPNDLTGENISCWVGPPIFTANFSCSLLLAPTIYFLLLTRLSLSLVHLPK